MIKIASYAMMTVCYVVCAAASVLLFSFCVYIAAGKGTAWDIYLAFEVAVIGAAFLAAGELCRHIAREECE